MTASGEHVDSTSSESEEEEVHEVLSVTQLSAMTPAKGAGYATPTKTRVVGAAAATPSASVVDRNGAGLSYARRYAAR